MGDLDFMGRIAESKIQEAIEEGKFDNLPGKGKPIIFDEDPMTPPHLRMVNRILANANVLPEWMQFQKDIEAERKQLSEMRARLVRDNTRWGARISRNPAQLGVTHHYGEWHARSRAAYLRLLKSLNTSILKFTLVAPSSAKPISSVKVEAEMAAFDSDVPAHVPYESTMDHNATSESRLRSSARLQYRGAAPPDPPAAD
jgi:hypothetical protein